MQKTPFKWAPIHISSAIYLDRTTFTRQEVEDFGDEQLSITMEFAEVPAIPTPIFTYFRCF